MQLLILTLTDKLSLADDDELISVTLILTPQADFRTLYSRAGALAKAERRAQVILELKGLANVSQRPLLNDLRALAKAGRAARIRPLWISNVSPRRSKREKSPA